MSEADDIRAKLKLQTAERAVKQQARADERELRELKQRLADNTAIAKAEDELGEQGVYIGCVETPTKRVIILKRPAFAKYREFQEKPKSNASDIESLCDSCRVYPDQETFDALCEEFPGMLTVMATVIARLAGTLQEDAAKK